MTIPARKKGPTSVDAINELSRSIGVLEGVVTGLAEAVRSQGETAESSRGALRDEIAALTRIAAGLTRDVEGLQRSVSAMQPTVTRVAEARLIGKGMLMGVSIVAALTGSGVAVLLQKIFGGMIQ